MKYKRTDFKPERKRKYSFRYDIICEVIVSLFSYCDLYIVPYGYGDGNYIFNVVRRGDDTSPRVHNVSGP